MGLSTKQVSSDGLDWSQALLQEQSFELKELNFEFKDRSFELKDQSFELKERSLEVKEQQQGPQQEQLKCPRCESTNTKFCYYNNYNQTQPRHFCRACKRHWTKGGTLRNVPVGGHSRKNKRSTKKPHSSSSSASKTTAKCAASNVAAAMIEDTNLASFDQISSFRSLNDHRLIPEQGLITSSEMGNHTFSSSLGLSSSGTTTTTMPFNFLQASRAHVPSFPFSSSSTTSNAYNYSQDRFKSMEESIITSSMPSTSEWNWEDIETLVSTDLNVTWDD